MTMPLVTSNRINMPEVAEQVLADGCADLVSMARPWLADGDIIAKAIEAGRRDQHLHRLQPGVPGPHLQGQGRGLRGQPARRPRNRIHQGGPTRPRRPLRGGWWRPGGHVHGAGAGQARRHGGPLREPKKNSAANSCSPTKSRAKKSSPRPCATTSTSSTATASGSTSAPALSPPMWARPKTRATRSKPWHGAPAFGPACPASPATTCRLRCLTTRS